MSKVIYTAIFGPYDDLNEPTVISEGWKYICFTDQPLQSKVWEIMHVPVPPDMTAQRFARWHKITQWSQWPLSMWLDASFQINMDLNLLWGNYFRSPFTAPKHPLRTCVYHEIESCIANYHREHADGEKQTVLLTAQKEAYLTAGVPRFGNNIITSGLLMREATPGCIELCDEWWKELCQHSVRDQVAFGRVSIGKEFHTFNWDYSQSRELKYIKHKHLRH